MSDDRDGCEDHRDDGPPCERPPAECPYCGGVGLVILDVTPRGELMTDCPECGGTGWR